MSSHNSPGNSAVVLFITNNKIIINEIKNLIKEIFGEIFVKFSSELL